MSLFFKIKDKTKKNKPIPTSTYLKFSADVPKFFSLDKKIKFSRVPNCVNGSVSALDTVWLKSNRFGLIRSCF